MKVLKNSLKCKIFLCESLIKNRAYKLLYFSYLFLVINVSIYINYYHKKEKKKDLVNQFSHSRSFLFMCVWNINYLSLEYTVYLANVRIYLLIQKILMCVCVCVCFTLELQSTEYYHLMFHYCNITKHRSMNINMIKNIFKY